MLTMAQVQNIRFLRNYKGMSLRAVAKETDHHFETVQKYLDKEDFNQKPRALEDAKPFRRAKLPDVFQNYLTELKKYHQQPERGNTSEA